LKVESNNILITGGTGMVGRAFIGLGNFMSTGSEYDLRDPSATEAMYQAFQPEAIIHLAAKVGGVRANTDYIADFCIQNNLINQNVLHAARENNVKKLVSLLSTCVYPDASYVSYPLTEDQLHLGPPHNSNFGYAHSKRMVDVMSRAYRQQYGCNYITAIPNNLYGENDNFHLEDSHVVPALIRKVWEAKIYNKPTVVCWGDGSPLREFTYSADVAEIFLFLLQNYDGEHPINIGNTEEVSILQVVELICEFLEYGGDVVWDKDSPSGQYKKPSSNKKLLALGWEKSRYTPLRIGLKKTCEWFIINYPNVRGIN